MLDFNEEKIVLVFSKTFLSSTDLSIHIIRKNQLFVKLLIINNCYIRFFDFSKFDCRSNFQFAKF